MPQVLDFWNSKTFSLKLLLSFSSCQIFPEEMRKEFRGKKNGNYRKYWWTSVSVPVTSDWQVLRIENCLVVLLALRGLSWTPYLSYYWLMLSKKSYLDMALIESTRWIFSSSYKLVEASLSQIHDSVRPTGRQANHISCVWGDDCYFHVLKNMH